MHAAPQTNRARERWHAGAATARQRQSQHEDSLYEAAYLGLINVSIADCTNAQTAISQLTLGKCDATLVARLPDTDSASFSRALLRSSTFQIPLLLSSNAAASTQTMPFFSSASATIDCISAHQEIQWPQAISSSTVPTFTPATS